MGVYIRGMEMPSCCEKCPVNTKDAFGGIGCRVTGYIPLRKADQDFPNWCPLVPVPPHGRLIDGDALIGLCHIMADKCDGIGESIWNQFATTVEWCPTIIPAEEADNGK